MSNTLPDLWDECYSGEHRKLLSPEQFKQTFCGICLNHGCRNSRGAGTLWNRRMETQEDRLLNNPNFADPRTAERMGMPDFKDLFRQALAIEISDRKGDWEPVTEAEIGQAAAEMVGLLPPTGFKKEEPPPPALLPCGHPAECDPARDDPNPGATHYCLMCVAEAKPKPLTAKAVIVLLREAPDLDTLDTLLPEGEKRRTVLNIYEAMQQKLTVRDPEPEAPQVSAPVRAPVPELSTLIPDTPPNGEDSPSDPPVSDKEDRTVIEADIEGRWKMHGTTPGSDGKKPVYEVTLYKDGGWSCSCPSRENPCKHARDIAGRMAAAPSPQPAAPENPTRPSPAPRAPLPLQMNTGQPAGGVMIGGGPPPVEEDPWAVPDKPKDRVIGVGGRVTFGSGKKK